GVLVAEAGRLDDGRVAVLLADTAGDGMFPVQGAVSGVALAGIESALLAINGDENDEVVELVAVQVVLLEDVVVAVDHGHGFGMEAGGAGEREKEHGEIVG